MTKLMQQTGNGSQRVVIGDKVWSEKHQSTVRIVVFQGAYARVQDGNGKVLPEAVHLSQLRA